MVCDEWRDFATFVRDAGAKPENAYALRRVDTKKLFSPDNVRWAIKITSDSDRIDKARMMRELSAKNRALNPDYYRDSELRKRYGITLDEYNTMLANQNGVCAICEQPEKRVDKRVNRVSYLAVDHCHETGKVRGLLCHTCNAMLGQSGDSIERLQQGIDYLKSLE